MIHVLTNSNAIFQFIQKARMARRLSPMIHLQHNQAEILVKKLEYKYPKK